MDGGNTEHLVVSREGALGVIALDRPQAINALDLGMVRGIRAALRRFAADQSIAAVLFEGRGDRGFCAGGDVRAVRELVMAGQMGDALGFFTEEYAMIEEIAAFAKPTIALTDGVVMGGGVGLAGHARFRATTERARYAMPESLIGFFADVGVNSILGKAPAHRALCFLLEGSMVGTADALALGLADCAVQTGRLDAVRQRLVEAVRAQDVNTAITAVLQAESVDPGMPLVMQLADRLAGCFEGDDAVDIVAALDGVETDEASTLSRALRARCPTSLEVIVASHRAARAAMSVTEVLQTDLRLARFMAGRPDFLEGVRAVLVDKDQKPDWQPQSVEDVDLDPIDRAIAGDGRAGQAIGKQA